MGKTTLVAIGGGSLSALASVATINGPPAALILAYLAPLPLLAVGLSLGIGAVALAAAVGVATVALIGGLGPAGVYGGMHALPCWLMVRQALVRRQGAEATDTEWYPIGALLGWLAVLAAVFGVAIALTLRGDAGIEASMRSFLHGAATTTPYTGAMPWDRFVEALAPMFLGLSGAAWQTMMIVNAVLAQSVLARRKSNLRPTPTWSALSLPDWMSWLLVGAAAVALIAPGDLGYLARNLALIFATPFFFLGLAVVHSLARTVASARGILAAFYVFLVLFLGFAAIAVTGLGVVEQWAGVRRRFAGAASGRRNE